MGKQLHMLIFFDETKCIIKNRKKIKIRIKMNNQGLFISIFEKHIHVHVLVYVDSSSFDSTRPLPLSVTFGQTDRQTDARKFSLPVNLFSVGNVLEQGKLYNVSN